MWPLLPEYSDKNLKPSHFRKFSPKFSELREDRIRDTPFKFSFLFLMLNPFFPCIELDKCAFFTKFCFEYWHVWAHE